MMELIILILFITAINLGITIGVVVLGIRIYNEMLTEDDLPMPFVTGLQTKPYKPVEWTTAITTPTKTKKSKTKKSKTKLNKKSKQRRKKV